MVFRLLKAFGRLGARLREEMQRMDTCGDVFFGSQKNGRFQESLCIYVVLWISIFFKYCFKTYSTQFVFTSLDLLNEELAKILEHLQGFKVSRICRTVARLCYLECRVCCGIQHGCLQLQKMQHSRLRSAKLANCTPDPSCLFTTLGRKLTVA